MTWMLDSAIIKNHSPVKNKESGYRLTSKATLIAASIRVFSVCSADQLSTSAFLSSLPISSASLRTISGI